MAEKCLEKYFDMPIGGYCGFLMKEPLAKKVQKLLYRQSQELKELLATNLSQLEISNWTLVYPNDEQTTVRYFTPSTEEDKLDRIKLLDKTDRIRYIRDVWTTTHELYLEAMNDVIDSYMEEFTKSNIETK